MLQAFHKGVSQLNDKETRQVVWICVGSAILVFIFLWSSIGMILKSTTLFDIGWLESIIDFMGGAATFLLTWFLFPGVVTAIVSLFLDKIVDRVEAVHYPHLTPAPRLDFMKTMIEIFKFLGVLIVVNIFVLFFLFIPPLFPFVFYGANGYLLSREYFELVAFRRMSPLEARALRKSYRGKLILFGVIMTLLLTIPVLNLLVPLVAAATMVHLFEAWRPSPAHALAT